MNKIDDSQTLFGLLKDKKIDIEDLKKITNEMFSRLEKLTEIKKAEMKDLFETSYVDMDLKNLETTREWLYMSPEFIKKEEADTIIDKLKYFVSNHSFFKDFDKNHFVASIDNHSGNIIYNNKNVSFIDSMPPMRIWRVQSSIYSISRPATDVEVIMGKEYSDSMYNEFERIEGIKIDHDVRTYFQIVASLIMAPYLYILKDSDLAGKFWDFSCNKIKEI